MPEQAENIFICACCKSRRALGVLPSPTKPRPAGVCCFKTCRKRASPQPAGEGLGVGVPQWVTA